MHVHKIRLSFSCSCPLSCLFFVCFSKSGVEMQRGTFGSARRACAALRTSARRCASLRVVGVIYKKDYSLISYLSLNKIYKVKKKRKEKYFSAFFFPALNEGGFDSAFSLSSSSSIVSLLAAVCSNSKSLEW